MKGSIELRFHTETTPGDMSQLAIHDSRAKTKRRLVEDSFSTSVLLLGFLVILQRGVGLLRSFYVCGALSPVEVGQWDLAFNFLTIMAPLAVFGIPGSFGRYVAQFENRGAQRPFFYRTLVVCIGLSVLGSGLILAFRETVAHYFFGGSANTKLVRVLALGLPAVVLFNFATCWFTGKRLNRLVFRIQFTQTIFFAVLCAFYLQWHTATADSVIVAYFLSCLVGIGLATGYACLEPASERRDGKCEQRIVIWTKILPFAAWVWVSNTLFNLFAVCDRLLLINFSTARNVDTQSLIGQYHTACIFPSLLMAIGAMAGSMGIPYLSKDWEAGRRDAVCRRMNRMLKLIGLLCLSASVGILLLGPFIFGVIWKNKFPLGESLLPMTLSYCSLAALTLVAQKYFWCIEKTRLSSLLLLFGLATNFGLGLALIGPFGLEGVVASTLAAHAMVFAGVLALCYRHGMKIDAGVIWIGLALLAVSLGVGLSCAVFAVVLIMAFLSPTLIDDSMKQLVVNRFPASSVLLGFKKS